MSYGERKYKEPDDLGLTSLAQYAWADISDFMAKWREHPERKTRKSMALSAFTTFYNMTAPELWHRRCNLDEMKLGRKDFDNLWQQDAFVATDFFDKYLRLLFDKGVISYQKVRDTDTGGHG